jgi:RNA polymerase sigma-70 factor (ECF subfamily)
VADGGKDLDAWVLATAADAVAYAASLLRDRAAAEDVVQDCYCRLWQKSDRYDLPRDGRKLLFAAVTNACINHNTRGRPHLSLEEGLLPDPRAGSPDRAVLRGELEEVIARGLGRLPVAQRAALELKSLGHSLEEIGTALETSAGAAGVLVHRARQAMARYLAPYLEGKAR